MPGPNHDDHSSPADALPALADRLGYLLKHAQLRLAQLSAEALGPLGVSGRETAVLIAIESVAPVSQQEAAGRLGVDRTTMVALVDGLEAKDLVQRRPDPDDRRKNVVALTDHGRAILSQAIKAVDEVERALLASLSPADIAKLKRTLRAIVS